MRSRSLKGSARRPKIAVLGSGTINGVDATGQFNPSRFVATRAQTRNQLGIPEGASVVGFVGRIVRDKGIIELVQAWKSLSAVLPNLHLLVVGPFESHDPLPAVVSSALQNDPRIHLTGLLDDAAPLYAAMDLVVLPTYREGFPTVALEAAAMALPIVATRVPGCIDAVQDGSTGTLVPTRDPRALTDAIRTYLGDALLRQRHGEAARERVLRDFRPESVWEAHYREYVRLLEQRGLRVVATRSLHAAFEPSMPNASPRDR